MDNEIFVVSDVNREIPIAPPSINELGSKNPFRPKPAETIPTRIKNISLIICAIFDLKILASLKIH